MSEKKQDLDRNDQAFEDQDNTGNNRVAEFSGHFDSAVAIAGGEATDFRNAKNVIYKPSGSVYVGGKPEKVPLQKPPKVPYFVGRESELELVLSNLRPGIVIALHGIGGVGKTAIASKIAWKLASGSCAPTKFPHGIITYDFAIGNNADVALEHICRSYSQNPSPDPYHAALRILADKEALLILDSTEDADDLKKVLDVSGSCGILITSQSRKDAVDIVIDVDPLPMDQAVEVLQAWGRQQFSDRDVATEILELVGGLPLAVRVAGHYLSYSPETALDYLDWLRSSPLKALDHGERKSQSVPYVLQRSVNRLSSLARHYLGAMSWYTINDYNLRSVAYWVGVKDESRSSKSRSAISELIRYGLIAKHGGIYQPAHSLIQHYALSHIQLPQELLSNFYTGSHPSVTTMFYTNVKGKTYYLHAKDVTLKSGGRQRLYFFAREIREGAIDSVPEGYKIVETKRTGMPVLKKRKLRLA